MIGSNPATKVIRRFSWRRSCLTAIVWALILTLYTYSKVIGYTRAYPSYSERLGFANLMSKTSGLSVLVGPANNVQTVAGYMVWATYSIMLVLVGVWAILTVTKNLRGDEQDGRFDVALSGQLKMRTLTMSILTGLFRSLLLFGVLLTIFMIGLSKMKGIDIPVRAMLVYSLAIFSCGSLFMSLAGLSSQIMPTRRAASGLALGFLGLSFITKAVADTTGLKWLLNILPLGWFERLRPLQNTNYIWLVPIAITAVVLIVLTSVIAAKRDLNDSWIKQSLDHHSRLRLLRSLPTIIIRFSRSNLITWGLIIAALGFFYGLLTKAAVGALAGSSTYLNAVNKLSSNSLLSATGAYVSVIFFINMIVLSIFATGIISSFRREELSGRDSNILIQPIGRIRYLASRLSIQVVILGLLSVLASISFWIGEVSSGDHVIVLTSLLAAGINAAVPAVIILAIGVLFFGRLPRASALICYAVVVWSILVNLLGDSISIGKHLKNSSAFSAVKLAPGSPADWRLNLELVLGCLVVVLVGAYLYKHRDLQTD